MHSIVRQGYTNLFAFGSLWAECALGYRTGASGGGCIAGYIGFDQIVGYRLGLLSGESASLQKDLCK